MLLLLVGLSAALVYYAAFTEQGLQFIVSHVPKRIGRAQLSITAPRGALASGFEVARIEIEHERSHLIFEGVRGRLAIAPLLWQTIDMRDARLRRAFIEVRRRTRPIKKYTPRFLPAGVVVRVERAQIDSATLIATNGRRFDTSRIKASGVGRPRTLRFFETSFDWDVMHVTGSTQLRAADPMQIEGDARISIAWPQQPVWIIDATGKGDLDSLALNAHFTAPFRADFAGEALTLTSNWNWRGAAQIHDFDLRAWGGGGALGRITGKLAVRGDARGFSGHGPLTPAGLRAGTFETLFQGSYADRTVTADRIELRHPSGTVLEGAGSIGIVSNGPRLNLHGSWRDFRWPLVGRDIAVRSAAGEYTLSGVWPYDWRASGPIAAKTLAAMPVVAQGRLAKDRVFLDAVAVEAFDGLANLSGEVLWTPDERWAVRGRAIGVNPGRLRADLPGKLNFDFEADGRGFDGNGDYAVGVRNLRGLLRKAPASGRGKLARRGAAWELDDIRLAMGKTQMSLAGRIAREVDLKFALDTEDLGLLAQGSRGQLHTQGSLLGTLEDPAVSATLRGNGIRYAGVSLDSMEGVIDFDARNTRPSKVDLRARNLAYGNRAFASLAFTLEGTAAAHQARFNAKAGALAVDARASGAFAHGAWNGELQALNFNSNEPPLSLALDTPVPLLMSVERMRVNQFCLRGEPARICADADWSAAEWTVNVNARDLPLTTLTSGLTRGVDYRGSIAVTAHAVGRAQQPLQGNLRAELVDARILHRIASGRLQSILLGSGLVTANATSTGIEAQMGLDAGRIGTIKAHIELARSANRWEDMPLRGELHVQTAELGFVTLYAPQIDRAAGKLAADLALSGTGGAPLVKGMIRLTEAELDQYQVNLALRGATLEAQLLGTGLDFNGSARIGAGEASSNGRLEWRDGLPYGKFHLHGENLRVTDVPEAQIDASPNLDFRIDGRRIEVAGEVTVPYAKIVPTDLRNAVRSSSDEVLVGGPAKDPSKQFEVVSDVTLALGQRVSIDTSGLTGRIAGSIAVRSGYDETTRGTGELSIEEGKYTAYGRKLDIQHGRLIFTGGPVGNPGVDIRAIKKFPEVIAGVNVRGTLLQPRLTFYSEPSLPQSQILSLILAGGSLATVQNKQTGNELLAQGGAILAQQLGERVGIEDVTVESNLANETSLVLGKYLSPRLYVSYGISLAESINTMKLLYSLNDHWTIKSEVGEARSADLVYTIEK